MLESNQTLLRNNCKSLSKKSSSLRKSLNEKQRKNLQKTATFSFEKYIFDKKIVKNIFPIAKYEKYMHFRKYVNFENKKLAKKYKLKQRIKIKVRKNNTNINKNKNNIAVNVPTEQRNLQ